MKELTTNLQEAYRTANRLDEKRNSFPNIIVKAPKREKKKRSRRQKIIKLKIEIRQVETKRTRQKLTKPGAGSLRKSTR